MRFSQIAQLYPQSMFLPDEIFDSAVMGITSDHRIVYSLLEMYSNIRQDIKDNLMEYIVEDEEPDVITISLATLKIYIDRLGDLLINEDFPPLICEDMRILEFTIPYIDRKPKSEDWK